MTTDAENFATILSQITGAPFTVDKPQENRLRLGTRALWFVWCSDIAYPREVGPLKAAWKDSDQSAWLETSKVTDMIELVEREYGEKGIHVMPDSERGVAPTGKIPEEVSNFPKVVDMLKTCESRVAEVSKKGGVHLEILYDGGVGVTTFRIGARIESPSADKETLRQQIVDTAKVLKEAYDEIGKIVWAE